MQSRAWNTGAVTAAPADPATDVFWRPSAALQVAHSHPRSRRVAQAIVAAICAFTIILTAAPAAFALGVSIAETSVAAQTSTGHSFVGAKTTDASTGVGENRAGIYDFTSGCCVAPSGTRFFAGNGPLDEAVAATFRSGTYDEVLLSQDTLLYRVYGGEAGPIGGYWSRTAPSCPMQAQMDSALNPAWGNLATDVSTIRVPPRTTIYEGAAAAQPLAGAVRYLAAETKSSFQELIRLSWWGDNERSSV